MCSRQLQNISKRSGRPSTNPESILTAEILSNLMHKIGHEIGNPLTAIISIASIIERFYGVSNEKSAPTAAAMNKLPGYASSIIEESWRITNLNEKLVLMLSKKPGNSSICPVIDSVSRATSKLRSRYKWFRTEIKVAQPADCQDLSVLIDPEQFGVLLMELISNANNCILYEQSPTLPPKQPFHLELAIDKTDDGVSMTFSNQRQKPCPFELSTLFEPMVTEFADKKHIGIGLSLAWIIVQRFSGAIELSEELKDDCYIFSTKITLPVATKP